MKQKQLEMLLQKVPQPQTPRPQLEQYMTPAPIAADILFTAYLAGDIEDKVIIDLGCGTGIFAVGAAIMGARTVIGIDIDMNLIKKAKEYATANALPISYHTQDIATVDLPCNTVLMNPPFGAQKGNQNADRKFIEKAFQISNVIYSLHLKKTIPFLDKMITSMNGVITDQKEYRFPIKAMFEFHEKQVATYQVSLLRILTHPLSGSKMGNNPKS
jgi:putative methylase